MMGFPMGDPFAYPVLPGVSLADHRFTALSEDTMRLPVFNMHADMEGQLMSLQPTQVSPQTSMPTSRSEYGYNHAISRGIDPFEHGLFWEPSGSYGSPLF